MRQFVFDKSDEETSSENINKTNEIVAPPSMTRKQHPMQLLSNPPKVRTITPEIRKEIISNIIK